MLERSNPVPPGVYWVDVPEPRMATFNGWLARNVATVKVVKVGSPNTGEYVDIFGVQLPTGNDPTRVYWVLFEVLAPTFWEGPGFPTVAVKGKATNLGDTAQKPSPLDTPTNTLTIIAAGVAGGLLLAMLLRR